MSRVEAQLRAMSWGRLLGLKAVAGDRVRRQIDAEINCRCRAAQSTTVTGTGAIDLAATGADTQHE